MKVLLVMWMLSSPTSIFGTAALTSVEECEKQAAQASVYVQKETGEGTVHMCLEYKDGEPIGVQS